MIVKFCGFKSDEDIEKVKDLNVDAVGFIHFHKSKRYVSINQIKHLTKSIPHRIDRVAVVVNPTLQLVTEIISETDINTIQLHGNESIKLINQIKQLNSELKIIKALPADHHLNENIKKYESYVDLFIIDTPTENYGGTGKVFDWNMLTHIRDAKFLIAGGLDIKHLKQLNQIELGQMGYDIASGIETNNKKDLTKMKEIIECLKGDE
ncbi:phosphoribosylanthranilate isomerase [Staphylococcus caprae]|uniref:phosphoribosylanthranilate isomerase n=1 Tax=Staphylococcus TaxID=1279 RepID=UPI0008A90E86|nr:phosphoribosylanthranilate isomerase [Staphylococcus sp. HMSC62A08]OHS35644.1 phosphoribosylanthranilate isomerase [Staphylococcus sp. HMSC62A08]